MFDLAQTEALVNMMSTRRRRRGSGKVALRRLKVRCEAPGEQQIKSPRGAAARPRPRWEPTRDNVSPKGKLEYFQRIT